MYQATWEPTGLKFSILLMVTWVSSARGATAREDGLDPLCFQNLNDGDEASQAQKSVWRMFPSLPSNLHRTSAFSQYACSFIAGAACIDLRFQAMPRSNITTSEADSGCACCGGLHIDHLALQIAKPVHQKCKRACPNHLFD